MTGVRQADATATAGQRIPLARWAGAGQHGV